MVYDHLVKHNGVYYLAGQDVPNGEVVEDKSSATKSVIEKVSHEITRNDIDAMNYMALKKLARDNGIEHDNKIKQMALKELLYNYFGV